MTHKSESVCPRTKGPHLPRYPVSWLNQIAGHRYECAYCGKGCDAHGEEKSA